MPGIDTTELRSRFACALSTLYGNEVPAYTTLLEVSHQINQQVLTERGAAAERLGSIERVTAERHGAIRVGSPTELAQVARIFGALGMYATGFYDLRDARPRPIPVVSTAFRPTDPGELARNPFRVFTSVLVPQDRRFFDADLERRLTSFLSSRRLFPDELLELSDAAESHGELAPAAAERFLELATGSFALSAESVDRAWYAELARISDVAADIGGVGSTHINHLTPRVLDIDELYRTMQARGIEMIDQIQGPPAWGGPDVLLRQTSFRALAEPRRFREADGSVVTGELRVRFGEVEARGIALTPAGRDRYDRMTEAVDRRLAERPDAGWAAVATGVWQENLPDTELELCRSGLGFFTYSVAGRLPEGTPPSTVAQLLADGWIEANPIVYEDFLPRSAAGIFASNLTGLGSATGDQGGADRDAGWISELIGSRVHSPDDLYTEQVDASLREVERRLGVELTGR